MGDEFDDWLAVRLKESEADEVFGPYIRTILEGDESAEDKSASLEDMLAGLGLEDVQGFKEQILVHWSSSQSNGVSQAAAVPDGAVGGGHVDLLSALASITDTRTKEFAEAKAKSAAGKGGIKADKDVKAAIMAQYSQVADEESAGEEEGDDEELGEGRNANKEAIAAAERAKREEGRAAAAAKKEKDKEDREKQKNQADERKKKAQEKSAKVERKR